MPDAIQDPDAADVSKPREHLLHRQYVFKQFQVLVQNLARFVEDDQHQTRLPNEWLRLHLAQIGHDALPPLRSVPAVTDATLSKLVRDLHLQPQRLARLAVWPGAGAVRKKIKERDRRL